MKKFISGITVGLVAGVVLTIGTSSFADSVISKVEAYINPSIPVTLDGQTISLDKPVAIIDGSSYLPVKSIGQVVGKDVSWNDKTKSIELKSVINPTDTVPSKDVGQVGTQPEDKAKEGVTHLNKDSIQSLVLLQNYFNGKDAYKDGNIVYMNLSAGGSKYSIRDKIVYNNSDKSITFKGSSIKINYNDSYANGCEAFNYDGSTYVKESFFVEASKDIKGPQ
ncbi:copper amine oxidase N-terminal domain-containing protein [Paenibacillus sp. SYP-B3998]|uniref:Copper amine oxidase N-terminal domain-containing protein n=1 Tax=Paenibacillus sp. SYP-B3998 TaxID=2678564 RepID=A0A6G4A1H2_9BACL|nr:stalk domain-containing protein [Paenibacillus sp. SYP-B3998]NEW08225.1 copper amine oxidase N-terminal domain-containing protein [Paenibacillus sp. SYP-B3998]